jgi:hypothetical protein
MSAPSLKQRFEAFMASLSSAENIDEILKSSSRCYPDAGYVRFLEDFKRADYLAFNRAAIIEQKSLEVDVDGKLGIFLNKLIKDRGVIGCGATSIEYIIKQMPDRDELNKKLFQLLSQGVDKKLSDCDTQIENTRELFLISEAIGIVVLLNENAQYLTPDLLVYRAFHTIRKRDARGAVRYPNIHAVLIISEAHRIIGEGTSELIPVETILSDTGAVLQATVRCTEALSRLWCAFNQAGYVDSTVGPRLVRTRDPHKPIHISS